MSKIFDHDFRKFSWKFSFFLKSRKFQLEFLLKILRFRNFWKFSWKFSKIVIEKFWHPKNIFFDRIFLWKSIIFFINPFRIWFDINNVASGMLKSGPEKISSLKIINLTHFLWFLHKLSRISCFYTLLAPNLVGMLFMNVWWFVVLFWTKSFLYLFSRGHISLPLPLSLPPLHLAHPERCGHC